MELGKKLRQARLEAGLSQRQLCGDVITRNMLSQIENGSAKPSMDTLQHLASQLHKPVSYFLEEQPVVSPNQTLMEQARSAAGQEVLDILAQYQSPDPLFDRERWLLEALTCLELSEKALTDGRKEYAGALLARAEKAGANTPYYTKEIERKQQILACEAGFSQVLSIDGREVTLLARSFLAQNAPEKCICILQTLDGYDAADHFLLAEAYLQLAQYKNAISHFLQAEAYDPNRVYAGLEKCYSALEDFKQAYFYACKQRQQPTRKQNRIPDYDYSQSGAYFITICTQDRKQILSQIVGDDAHIVPKPYGQIVEKYIKNTPEIEKYVIMPDHIHLIIRLDNGTMWASSPTENKIAGIIRSIKTLASKEIGQSIFQRSYYDHVIRNQQDYNEIWEYIENNPKKWLLTKNGERW